VTFGPESSYEDVAAGLQATPGSGNLYANATTGMGTDAIGNVLSIQSGSPNESIVLEIFRSSSVVLLAPEGATDVMLFVDGASSTGFSLAAEDKDGVSLGSAPTTSGTKTVDVSALISGEIHKLTIEATSSSVIIVGLDYTHVCLGYTP